MAKTELSIEIDSDPLERARASNLDIAALCTAALELALAEPGSLVASSARQKLDPAGAEERGRRWAEENVEAIKAYAKRIALRGCFGEDLRRW